MTVETIVANITGNPKEDDKIYDKAGEILRAGGISNRNSLWTGGRCT